MVLFVTEYAIRSKIPWCKRLVVSSKVLFPAIPTQNCDVVLTFPAHTDDATLMWLLLQGAEELGILKPLKAEYGGGMKEFAFEDQDCFVGIEDETKFLTSRERQSIVLHFLHELRATGEDNLSGITFIEGQPIGVKSDMGSGYFLKTTFGSVKDLCHVGFCFSLNVIWATLYLKFGKEPAVYCYRWGTLEKKDDMLKDPRPLLRTSNELR
ncbi:hypothetical protein Btru_030721 [Bulinus truncatus]|nr:hypothetical protein Btru_030721 [Bulinus truncatus]